MKSFFRFTKGERRGIYCLVVLVLVLLGVKWYLNEKKEIAELQLAASINADSIKAVIDDSSANAGNTEYSQKTPKEEKSKQAYRSSKQNYKSTPSKAEALDDESKAKVAAIKQWQAQEEKAREAREQQRKQPNAGLMIELNSADTTELKKLWGIGSKLSLRIVKYRDKLGGFYAKEQLAEIYGLQEETLLKTLPHVTADSSKITPLNVNTASISELKKHPYLSYYMAVAIDSIRAAQPEGKITNYGQISSHRDFSSAHPLLRHYLSFE